MARLIKFIIVGLVGLAAVFSMFACAQQNISQQNPVSCTPVLVAQPAQLTFLVPIGPVTVAQQPISIINKGTGDLNWVIGDNSPWITIQQSSGISSSAGLSVNVVVDVRNMPAGDYTGIVTVASEGALNSPVYIPVFLTVGQPGGSSAAQKTAPVTPTTPPGASSTANPPGDAAAAWNNKTDLYRYAGAYSCIVSGSIANTDAVWYMGNVQIITQSGKSALISDSIQPGEQVIYYRFIPCYDNDAVRLSYRWYRP